MWRYCCFGWRRNEEEIELQPLGGGAQRNVIKFSYHELETATNNFMAEFVIGVGRFGRVYRGRIERTGQIIVVKNLSHSSSPSVRMFKKEVITLSHLRHPNLINLIGYCAEGGHRLLVYEFMPLGSLASQLHDQRDGSRVLDWNTRMMIATGAAEGLHYLHTEANPPVVFRDLKSSNILLDEGFHPKLSDFGLAKFETLQVSNRDRSADGYSAPEYADTGRHTIKTDVYSFGMLLMELISGYRPAEMFHGSAKHLLVEWGDVLLEKPHLAIAVVDAKIQSKPPLDCLHRAMEVALLCAQDNPASRPNIIDMVQELAAAVVVEHTTGSSVEHTRSPIENVEEEEEGEETRLLRGRRSSVEHTTRRPVESDVVENDEIEEEEEEEEEIRLVRRRRSERRHEE